MTSQRTISLAAVVFTFTVHAAWVQALDWDNSGEARATWHLPSEPSGSDRELFVMPGAEGHRTDPDGAAA